MKKGYLALTVKDGEVVRIGNVDVFIRKHNGNLRLCIKAPKDIPIDRPKEFVKPKDKDL